MKKRLEALWCALFRVNKNATGYTWPICRILLCLLSYWLLTVVNGSRPMSTPRAVVFVLLIVLTWGLFYGVICALVEISIVRKHRRSPKTRQPVSGREKAAGKPFSLEQLAALAEENDIVELRLLHGSRTVPAGSSSDYTPQKGFFDKRYYVGSKEMETIDDFRRALEPYAPGGTVTVLTIDGVKPQ